MRDDARLNYSVKSGDERSGHIQKILGERTSRIEYWVMCRVSGRENGGVIY